MATTYTDQTVNGAVASTVAADYALDLTQPTATNVAAIKTKTDNLPANTATVLGTPAGASISADIAAAKAVIDLAAVNSTVAKEATLGTPAGASVSADIAAIKAVDDAIKLKTDLIPAAPASESTLGTPAGASVSADIAAVKAVVDLAAVNSTVAKEATLKTIVHQWGNGVVTKSTTSYLSKDFSGQTASTTVESLHAAPRAGTAKNLRIRLLTNSDRDTVYTLRVNGVDSALTCTVSAAGTSGSDVAHTVAIAAGDILSVSSVNAAGAALDQTGVVAMIQLDLT